MAPMPSKIDHTTRVQQKQTLALVAGLAELRHHGVGGVGDNGADDTGKVARGEGHTELSALGVLGFGLGEHVRVEQLHHLLKEEELGLHDGHSQ